MTFNQLVERSQRIVFFGGAGVSTPSGIPDFRSGTGLYSQGGHYPPETILSHTFFINHTQEFYDFYRSHMLYLTAGPNEAHRKLTQLEKSGKLLGVITQNIDGLHQAAGTKRVLELHGSVHRNYCMNCHTFYPVEAITQTSGLPTCTLCNGLIKPDVVLYEESLDPVVLQESAKIMGEADLLIVGGTSLSVYPASGFVDLYDGPLVIINQSPTPKDHRGTLLLRDSIDEVFSTLTID